MTYLDVTAGCLLPLQTGIPRTTRGIHRVLKDATPPVVPVCWQPFRRGYTRLSVRAESLLEDPFAGRRARGSPRDATLPLLAASLSDLRFWPDTVPLHRLLGPEDALLLTSLFPDNRLGYLRSLARAPGRRIAIFHDAIPLFDPGVVSWERARHVEALRIFAGMDKVIAVSRAAAEEFRTAADEHGIEIRNPPVVLAWPVPFEEERPPFSSPVAKPLHLLYVSRLKKLKNHATLFAACENLWSRGLSFHVDLIGCEDEARESRAILRRIEELRRQGRSVSWHGHVSETGLHAAYQRAAFTVFPSLREGFGLPVIESLWHGRPVVCGGTGAVGELAREGGCRITDVRNAEALAASIGELLTDETLRLNLSREACGRRWRTWRDYGNELKALLAGDTMNTSSTLSAA